MSKIKRWLDKRRVVWTEPALPKYVKINPNSPPGAAEGIQPGDFSMLKITEEFLEEAEEFPEAPEEGLALPSGSNCLSGHSPAASGCWALTTPTREQYERTWLPRRCLN